MPPDSRETEKLSLSNEELARQLSGIADILDSQHANPFRVNAYRAAAATIQAWPEPVSKLWERQGLDGLRELPGIGESLSRAIEQLTLTGHSSLLDQIRGTVRHERVLTTVAGIGSKTAARIHDELGIQTLAELEAAAYDGRLAAMPGMGEKKVRSVRESLAGRFRRRPKFLESQVHPPPVDSPPVAELLDIDEEYRHKAAADRLPRISPSRFNPTGEAWLPILHTHRGDRHYSVLFSNTARAHELGTTHDWVIIYRDDHRGDGQWTVITSLFGEFRGRRIVRGREGECWDFYHIMPAKAPDAGS